MQPVSTPQLNRVLGVSWRSRMRGAEQPVGCRGSRVARPTMHPGLRCVRCLAIRRRAATANVLTNAVLDLVGKILEFKYCAVCIEPIPPTESLTP